MYASRLIYKESQKKLAKMTDGLESEVSEKLSFLFGEVIKNHEGLLKREILNLKNIKKQINDDCDKLSEKKNTKKEIKQLKKYRSKIKRKIERLESFSGTSDFKKKLEKKSEKIMLHSKCVYVIAKEINSRLEEQADEKMIEYATMMHDAIKLVDSSYKHSIKSSRLLKDLAGEHFFEEALTEQELNKIARAITLHNKREKIYKGTRYTEEERLACILHDADKISKIFKKSSWKKKGKYLKVKKYVKVQKKIRKTLLFIESEQLLEEYRGLIIPNKRDPLRFYKFITLKKDFRMANQPQVIKASSRKKVKKKA